VKTSKLLTRMGIGVAAAVSVGATIVAVPSVAFAAQIGSASIAPATGDANTIWSLTTNGFCPAGATNVIVAITGGSSAAATPAAGTNLIGNTALSILGTTAVGYSVPGPDSFHNIASAGWGTTTLDGLYTYSFKCTNSAGFVDLGTFVGTITFVAAAGSNNGTYTNTTPAPATATALAVAPASPQTFGTSLTLTATVTGPGTTVGSVAFMDGATLLGTSATNAGGVATLTNSTLPVATHSLTAVFTPTNATLGAPSTSAPVSFVITGVPATPTTTTMSVTPTSGPALVPVAVSATVTPATAVGTVNFLDGTSVIGTGPVVAGAASASVSFTVAGLHSLTAQFVPTNPANFAPSTSPVVPFTATAATTPSDPQNVKATVAAGTMTITSPYHTGNPFNLGTLALNTAGTQLSMSASFGTITITDGRAGNLAWTASVTSTDFTGELSALNKINGENLGLTALSGTYTPGNALQLGSVTFTDNPAASPAVSPTDAGSLGLKNGPHVFAHATNGSGSVGINGTLTLNAPTSTAADTYDAIVTFTIA
jgi:Bacterial Ig-like domain (group 3)